MMRLEKARFEAKDKVERQHSPINITRDYARYKRIASISADNSICYVRKINW